MNIIADNPNVIFEILDGEMVMINLDSGCYYTMNECGAALWAQLKKAVSVDSLGEAFAKVAGQDQACAAQAIQAFVAKLQAEGLVRETAEASDVVPTMPAITKLEAPQLMVFRDMQDLLLLDPVHEISEQGWPHVKQAS